MLLVAGLVLRGCGLRCLDRVGKAENIDEKAPQDVFDHRGVQPPVMSEEGVAMVEVVHDPIETTEFESAERGNFVLAAGISNPHALGDSSTAWLGLTIVRASSQFVEPVHDQYPDLRFEHRNRGENPEGHEDHEVDMGPLHCLGLANVDGWTAHWWLAGLGR